MSECGVGSTEPSGARCRLAGAGAGSELARMSDLEQMYGR